MKLALIAIGLFAITGQPSLAFARGGLHLLDPSLNPQHINGLPADVRNALAHMCRGAQAQHQFAGYSQNLRTLVLHFERLHCGDRGAFCTRAGCLHQVYVSEGGRIDEAAKATELSNRLQRMSRWNFWPRGGWA
jgi:hypothetical protein